MVLLCCAILALITSLLVSIILPLTSISQFWIPLVVFIGGYFGFIILYLLKCLIWSFCLNTKKEYNKQNKIIHFQVINALGFVKDFCRVKVKVNGMEKVPTDGKYLVVYNHCSKFDPLLLSYYFRKDNLIQITKMENLKVLIGGPFMYRDCFLCIDRENVRNAAKTIIKASNFIQDNLYSVCIAPEGTRNKENPQQLLPFRDGCFKIAYRSQCPIVVVELHNTYSIYKRTPWLSTKVELNVLSTIPYNDYKDLHSVDLGEIVRNQLQNQIDSHQIKK